MWYFLFASTNDARGDVITTIAYTSFSLSLSLSFQFECLCVVLLSFCCFFLLGSKQLLSRSQGRNIKHSNRRNKPECAALRERRFLGKHVHLFIDAAAEWAATLFRGKHVERDRISLSVRVFLFFFFFFHGASNSLD